MDLDTITTSFSLGLLATASPCVLPLYPGFLAYLSSGHQNTSSRFGRYFLGVFVLAGVLTMMLILGAAIAALSVSVGQALSIFIPIADLLIIALGGLLLLNFNPFKTLPQVQSPLFSHPYANAFLYGLLYGPVALPCSGPLVVGIFAFSLTAGQALEQLAVFLWFGLGFGLPLLIISLFSGSAQRWITRQFAIHSRLINITGGLLLVGIGVYDLVANYELLRAFFQFL